MKKTIHTTLIKLTLKMKVGSGINIIFFFLFLIIIYLFYCLSVCLYLSISLSIYLYTLKILTMVISDINKTINTNMYFQWENTCCNINLVYNTLLKSYLIS